MTDNQNSKLTPFKDIQIESLQLKIKEVEIEINALENNRVEIEKLVHEFEVRYNKELGEIILKILKIKKERLQEETKTNQAKQTEFSEAKKDYYDFKNSYDDVTSENIVYLTFEEKEDLKNKYRKASKLCHPDLVTDNLKEEAEQMFKNLNAAYGKNDITTVNEILISLEKGIFTSKSDVTIEYDKLKRHLERLIIKRNNLSKIIENIKETATYKIIDEVTDWDKYFLQLKKQLERELAENYE